MQSGEHDFFSLLVYRFSAGVTHSFTDSAEDRDKLLTFSNMYIGEDLAVHLFLFVKLPRVQVLYVIFFTNIPNYLIKGQTYWVIFLQLLDGFISIT